MTPRPLAGLTVIDLSQYIAGPACAQVLADFGADVLKVEPPAGDPSRQLGETPHGSVYFRQYNTGKRCVRLDLASETGRTTLDAMLAEADAVVMNFAARTRRKLGLDGQQLRQRHPHLVITTVSAYGPDDDRTALDSVIQAQSGYATLSADADGAPRIAAGYPTDVFSGLYAGLATAMALLDASRDGGTEIDVPMIEVAMVALCGTAALGAASGSAIRAASGNRDIATAPSTVFPTLDGSVYIYAGLDKHWERLRSVVDGPAASAAERLADPDRFERTVAAWTESRTAAAVLEEMERLGIAAAPVERIDAALATMRRERPGAVIADIDGVPVPQFPATFGAERIRRAAATEEEIS